MERDETGADASTSDTSGPRLYRWTCPYCGHTGIQSATPENVERYVVNSVRTHVQSTDGNGHGPRRQYPPDEDVESAILEHVEPMTVDD